MVDLIAHRGPDDAGYLLGRTEADTHTVQLFADCCFLNISPHLPVIDSPQGKALLASSAWTTFFGHRRLSILDLSPKGHQPMCNEDGSVWLTYNGEIYNFRELRSNLLSLGHRFASGTDSEVIVHAFEQWGIDCITRFEGMFAFALWDCRSGRFFLARDRYGIKPLYYCRSQGCLVFASEIKSILEYLEGFPGVDLMALNEYFSFQNVFTDRTLFAGVTLLPAGHHAVIPVHGQPMERKRYWDFDFTREDHRDEKVLQDELGDRIRGAVKRHSVSDVPIGSYLSGGMDSGTITALTQRRLGRIYTFTAGFDLSEAAAHEMTFDERESAEKMANLFQTEHYECVLHSGDMEAVMNDLVWHLEDLRVGQCYPNYYIARLAGKFVKVVMSGMGGDELFGGYPWRYAAAIGDTHEDYVQNYYQYWKRLVRNRDKPALFNDQTRVRLAKLTDNGAVPFRDHTISVFQRVFGGHVETRSIEEQVNRSLYFECKTFLHGLLVVEDKLSMAHSLETRVPFLDNQLVDFAMRIPVRMKVMGIEGLARLDEDYPRKKALYAQRMHTGKSILRKAAESILPANVRDARKQGFSAPDESWFRGKSEDYIRETLLQPSALLREYLSEDYIEEALRQHTSGERNRRLLIWSLLSFETWLRRFAPRDIGD
jgi:asparagine synthase (glutamine-hydrolysing)